MLQNCAFDEQKPRHLKRNLCHYKTRHTFSGSCGAQSDKNLENLKGLFLFYVFEKAVLYWKGISHESDSFLQMYQRNVSRMAAPSQRQQRQDERPRYDNMMAKETAGTSRLRR